MFGMFSVIDVVVRYSVPARLDCQAGKFAPGRWIPGQEARHVVMVGRYGTATAFAAEFGILTAGHRVQTP